MAIKRSEIFVYEGGFVEDRRHNDALLILMGKEMHVKSCGKIRTREKKKLGKGREMEI